jgi:hypothetical protein
MPTPTFLPLTLAAVGSAATSPAPLSGEDPTDAQVIARKARLADDAAADCWMTLLAGCHTAQVRGALPVRLRELSEAAARYAGQNWWYGDGSHQRHRVARAEERITEAVRDSDGADFAEAFIGYDQAVATAVVTAQSRMGTPAQ